MKWLGPLANQLSTTNHFPFRNRWGNKLSIYFGVVAGWLSLTPFAHAAEIEAGTTLYYVINAVIAIAAVSFAVGVTAFVVQNMLTERKTLARLRQRLNHSEGKLYWVESILAAEPTVVLVWDAERLDEEALGTALTENEPDASAEAPRLVAANEPQDAQAFIPLGKPHILGSPKALGSILGAVGSIESGGGGLNSGEITVFDLFLTGLKRQDKSRLVAAIQDLKMEGEAFSLMVESLDNKTFHFEGRTAGGKAVVWIRDVTQEDENTRVLAGRLEKAEEERNTFVELLDAAPFPVWRRDRYLKLQWVNRAYVRAVEEASAQTVIESTVELDHGGQSLARKAAEEIDFAADRRYVVIDGQRRALDLFEMPLSDGTVGVALDATDLDEAENVLQRHIDAHAQTLNTLANAVAIFGPDKRLIFHNNAFDKLWRLDSEWLDGQPSDGELLERLREQRRLPEQADFPAWKRQRLDLYSNLIDQKDEMWHLPDGRTLRVIMQPHPFGGLIYLYEDVTDLITLESNINQHMSVQRATLDNLHEGVGVFGSDGRVKLWNAAFENLWKLSAEKLNTEPHFSQVSEWCSDLVGDPEKWAELQAQITSSADERKPFNSQMDRTDGMILNYGSMPLPDGATLVSFLDVTDSMQIERALRERNEALETADRLKSEFVNHVSYQLRTPLNSINGFTQMLNQKLFGELNEKQLEYTDSILEASAQLLNLINDIIDLATIEAGGMALEVEEVDLYTILESTMSFNQKKALDRNITLKLACDKDVGTIYADERRVKQILFNLITNGMSFTETGGSVTIGADKNQGQISLWVEDNGSGIEPKYQATVFDRFENRGGEGKRGAGLGLSLVKSFVELHGGWVSLESTPGVGTKVVCHLVDQAQRDAAAQ